MAEIQELPDAPDTHTKLKASLFRKAIDQYRKELAYYKEQAKHELGVRTPFQNLLVEAAHSVGWKLSPERTLEKGIRPDAILRDAFDLRRGLWEAKGPEGDLDKEIDEKIKKGYPLTNIIFENTQRAILYQNKKPFEYDLTNPDDIADLLIQFLSYTEPDIANFEAAIKEFQGRIPQLAKAVLKIIEDEYKNKQNPRFKSAFDDFTMLCRSSINPNISSDAIKEMLVQHLLTERLFRTIFNNPGFVNRNIIATEIEKVIQALTIRAFDRQEFLQQLDRFYVAIESAAKGIESWSERQHFLNTVYEHFFKGFSVKQADIHGIVYTPQEIVDFMCASVEEALKRDFDNKSLGDKGVQILDPAVGTGNFIVNLIRHYIPRENLQDKYENDLFCNEITLLPYYIASLNIEHEFFEKMRGGYAAFEGICFADTLELTEELYNDGADVLKQAKLFLVEGNTKRVEKENALKYIDNFVNTDPSFVKWTDRLKEALYKKEMLKFDEEKIRLSLYRPFSKQFLYFDHLLNQRRYRQPIIFPTSTGEEANTVICFTTLGSEKPFMALATDSIPDLHLVGAGAGAQCFPYYTYSDDGSNRQENITDWAQEQFQAKYGSEITKRDIFHYVYAILHHPQYRDYYAEDLKRSLPHIPLIQKVEAFWCCVSIGKQLMILHVNYDKEKEYDLTLIDNETLPYDESRYVEKMRLSPDRTAVIINKSLTLNGIPQECFEYRLGNRSALEWVIDQYQVTKDKQGRIISDPNRLDDKDYIIRLIRQVVAVSVQTVRLVNQLVQMVNVEDWIDGS